MAIPVIESDAITNSASGTTVEATVPSGVEADDIILIVCSIDGDAANPTSTDFATLTSVSEGSVEMFVLWKRATGGDTGTYTVNWTGTEIGRFTTIRISGCITTGDPWDVIGGATTSDSATTLICTALTSTVIDTLAIALLTANRNRVQADDGLTVANGFTEFSTSGNSGVNGAGTILAEKDLASIGSSLQPTFGTWIATDCCSRMFNLLPAAPTGVEFTPLVQNNSLVI